jgi:hypothetical protein
LKKRQQFTAAVAASLSLLLSNILALLADLAK